MMSGVAAAATAGDESSRPKGGGGGGGDGDGGGGDGEADGGGGNGGAAGGDGHVSFSHASPVSSRAQAHLLSLSLYAQGKYIPGYIPSLLPTKNLAEHSTVARSAPHDSTCTLPAS